MLFSLLLAIECIHRKGTEFDREPPVPPVLLPSPADSSAGEIGTDAIPESNSIELVWLSNREEDLGGYKVWRREKEETVFSLLRIVPKSKGAEIDTACVDSLVSLYKRYYYRLTAFDESGNESTPSNIVDYLLVGKAFPGTPSGDDIDPVPTFTWWPVSGDWPPSYIVKVYDLELRQFVWIGEPIPALTAPQEISYNADGKATEDSLVSGRSYKWRVDATWREPAGGSESMWRRFIVK